MSLRSPGRSRFAKRVARSLIAALVGALLPQPAQAARTQHLATAVRPVPSLTGSSIPDRVVLLVCVVQLDEASSVTIEYDGAYA